ncbi:unnamed protein product [Adineta ricciae]|uniref:PDZ domain-containing protein n=1 Tax=Adineta ricciae TaxID=249248 RepID=A0A813PVS7_ADIRI|nr:unnamed protein product [Adineta ricciae]CAF0955150.1 unnamed protein product [Adineta ricciae]
MNETDEYSNVQRRLCAVIAKSEWTSSRMRMQKSGEELRERRAKSHRTANQFLQELLEKRTDSDLIDDHGAVDRYHHFVKSKSTLHDDKSTTLDEFHRRLRDLNNNNYHQNSPIKKLPDINFSSKQSHDRRSTTTIEIHHDEDDDDERSKRSRIFPSISILPATSTPNDTTHELTTSSFHVDEIQNLSYVQSPNTSFIHNSTNLIESSLNEHHHSSLLDKFEALNYSSTLSSAHLQIPTVYIPKARRADGTELVLSSPSSSSPSSSSLSKSPVLTNISLFNHSYLPRSLTTRGKSNVNSTFKRQLPAVPSSDQKPVLQEHISSEQLYDLLDNLDTRSSQDTFTHKLEQITVSTKVPTNEESHIDHSSVENSPVIDYNEKNILSNLFNHCQTSSQEEQFYSTFQINIEDVKDLTLYTMTLSTVQLSASILLPYSILNGRRPLLTCSNQTCFKKISSKQPKNTYQVTAIEKSLNATELQPNDIILKINDQSVWGMTTDEISELLRTSTQRYNPCPLTFARLCQPFI